MHTSLYNSHMRHMGQLTGKPYMYTLASARGTVDHALFLLDINLDEKIF
jgi:hypothetical protein